jgi:hypothetical protein
VERAARLRGERDEQRDADAHADLLRRDVDRTRDAVIALRDAGQRGGGEAGEAFIDAVLEPAG